MNDLSDNASLADFLNKKVRQYNTPEFIDSDPVCIPHLYTKKQDIEISGFFAAIFAWGNRTTIINKGKELMERMDNSPYQFCLNHTSKDLKTLTGFKHRTFNDTDLWYCIDFFKHHYSTNISLETAFFSNKSRNKEIGPVQEGLNYFRRYFLSLKHLPDRTRKHIASPERHSSCKRLNMFLRWMVRNDNHGVDFGIWKNIRPKDLICPVDVHVARVARYFKLLERKQVDWEAAVQLTNRLRVLDPVDPVKYDFALFALGVMEKF